MPTKLTTPLFGNVNGPDEMYNRLRSPAADASEYIIRGRAFSENLWQRTSDFVGSDLQDKATGQFDESFRERSGAARMLHLGLPLVPPASRKSPNAGPDLQLGRNVWIEAIAVTAGTGP